MSVVPNLFPPSNKLILPTTTVIVVSLPGSDMALVSPTRHWVDRGCICSTNDEW